MSDSKRKEALEKIELLEQTNKQMENELKELEAIHDKDEETQNKITSLKDKIETNNTTLNELKNLLKEEIDKQVDNFMTSAVSIENHLLQVKATLVLESNVEEANVSDLLTGLTDELKEFEVEANALVQEMVDYIDVVGINDFNLSPKEINAKVKEFKTKLKKIKQEQIVKYNLRIERINTAIREYKSTVKEDMEGYDLVCELEILSECTAVVSDWRHITYLSEINYNKLLETVNKIRLVEGTVKKAQVFDSVKEKLKDINARIVKIDLEVNEDIDYLALVSAKLDLETISDLLLSVCCEIEQLKGTIDDSVYDKYNNEYRELMQYYLSLEKKIRDIEKKNDKEETTDYNKLFKAVDVIMTETLELSSLVASLYGRITSETLVMFESKYIALDGRTTKIKAEIEKAYADKLIDDNQYNNLLNGIDAIRFNLNNINTDLKDPKMFNINNENDIFSFLNGSIDGVEKTIDNLEKTIDKMEKPIKDRKTKKDIAAIFKKIESEIRTLEKQLNMYKDSDPEKYESTKERLNAAKKRLGDLGKVYRRKCPLRVTKVKSGKNFFKKYKKVLLIAAGIAAFAMLSHSIIIPAIMHGNIMIGAFSPVLRGPLKTINNLLGGLIGATQDKMGFWYLSNGVRINAHAAASSLLKGLAISGIGSAALIAPVVVAVKKLIEKIKLAELKQKLSDGKDKVVAGAKKGMSTVKTTISSGVKKTKEKTDEMINSFRTKKANSKTRFEFKKSIIDMFKDYSKSGLSVSEYCEQNEIAGVMAELLNAYAVDAESRKEKLGQRKGGK